MKKNGFTLAEVLITLTIIGVIATMTLPALLTNTQEQQAKTALKKGMSTMTDIGQMNQAIDGFDYSGLRSGSWGDSDPQSQTLFAMLANRGSIDFQKSTNSLPTEATSVTGKIGNTDAPDAIVYFRDGSALLYNQAGVVTTSDNAKTAIDGLPLGVTVIYDTNGAKGPNILSNCEGDGMGTKADTDARYDSQEGLSFDGDETAAEEVRSACIGENVKNRVIKDQFTIRLRGGHAMPYGAAAQWAYDN